MTWSTDSFSAVARRKFYCVLHKPLQGSSIARLFNDIQQDLHGRSNGSGAVEDEGEDEQDMFMLTLNDGRAYAERGDQALEEIVVSQEVLNVGLQRGDSMRKNIQASLGDIEEFGSSRAYLEGAKGEKGNAVGFLQYVSEAMDYKNKEENSKSFACCFFLFRVFYWFVLSWQAHPAPGAAARCLFRLG